MDTAGTAIGFGGLVLICLLVVLFVWVYFRIFSKAGFSGWLALLMLVPLVNVGMLFFLAFAEWPALRNRQNG